MRSHIIVHALTTDKPFLVPVADILGTHAGDVTTLVTRDVVPGATCTNNIRETPEEVQALIEQGPEDKAWRSVKSAADAVFASVNGFNNNTIGGAVTAIKSAADAWGRASGRARE